MRSAHIASQSRNCSNVSTIDRLALSRAQHLQFRENRPKSISDDEIDAISDWSDSDRECDLLSDFESSTSFHSNGDNKLTRNASMMSHTIETHLPNINGSTTSTQVSVVMESEKPKQRFIKNQSVSSIRARQQSQAPLLPGRRIQTKQMSPYHQTNHVAINAHLSYPLRNLKTPSITQNPSRFPLTRENSSSSNFTSRLGTDSSLSTYSSSHTHDDNHSHQQTISPTCSQTSIPRAYEIKKIFVADCDYGRLTDSSIPRPSQPRSRQKWGTIVHPPFPLGYQHIAPQQVIQTVERLASPVRCRDRHPPLPPTSKRYLSVEQTDALINRLTKVKTSPSPDPYWPIQRPTGSIKTLHNNWKSVGIPA